MFLNLSKLSHNTKTFKNYISPKSLSISNRKVHSDSNLIIDHTRVAALKLHQENKSTPINVYNYLVDKKYLKPDSHQKEVVDNLNLLYDKICNQKSPVPSKEISAQSSSTNSSSGGFFKRLFAPPESSIKQKDLVYGMETQGHRSSHIKLSDPSILGMYLHGDVGCGKTMMMDMFYSCLEVNKNVTGTRRIHFNEFMLDVHKRLHKIKKNVQKVNTQNKEGVNKRASYETDVIPILADQLMTLGWVLCFDEFQVTDIADAMILKRLFSELWKRGVVCVVTGNRRPGDLYKNGLQYQNFQPFIPLLSQHTEDIFINSGIDYRRMELSRFGDTFILQGSGLVQTLLLSMSQVNDLDFGLSYSLEELPDLDEPQAEKAFVYKEKELPKASDFSDDSNHRIATKLELLRDVPADHLAGVLMNIVSPGKTEGPVKEVCYLIVDYIRLIPTEVGI